MSEYIKRDSVTNLIKLMEYPNGVIECYADEFISDINAIPSADVAKVRHGKWEHDTDGLPRCSHCDEIALQRIMLHFPANQYFSQFVHSNFCPHCGARMDGE